MADPDTADAETRLSALVDPPLGTPPPLADLERRAQRIRRRRVAGRATAAAAAALALVAGAAALLPHDRAQTVQTAAPGIAKSPAAGAASNKPAEVTGKAPVPPQPLSFAVPVTFPDGTEAKLVATDGGNGSICLDLAIDKVTTRLDCLTPDSRPVQAALADVDTRLIVYGIASADVTAVSYGPTTPVPLALLGKGNPFPVQIIGEAAPSGTNLTVTRKDGSTESLPLGATEIHRRVDSINGSATPPAPPTASSPPATSPPGSVPPPVGANPLYVEADPTAINLHKSTFVSSAASGTSGVTVQFWGGAPQCDVLGRVDVVETATSVTITLWTGTPANATKIACIDIAVFKATTVALKAPLGTRTVVDGAA